MRYFKLFACCKIVKGACRSIIMDLQRNQSETIPNDLFDFIYYYSGQCKDEITTKLGIENQSVVDEYTNFLLKNEYGFLCDSLDEFNCFPEISDEWDIPFPISNAIIDIGINNDLDYLEIIRQINELRIPHIQIRSTIDIDFHFYEKLMKSVIKSNINSIQLLIPFPKNDIPIEMLKKFVRRNLRIDSLIFHSAPFNKKVKNIGNLTSISFTKKRFTSVIDCGIVSKKYFAVNLDLYTESTNFNTCLNRKISIDVSGEIKNCPTLKESFGNIKNKKLCEVLKEEGFKSLWFIKKDNIDVCKDCEFRHLCTDCRAIIKEPDNIFSQPAKCNYNPYIAKWKGEKGFISVEKWLQNNTQ